MNFILAEYLPLAIFLIVALVISCLFILANFLVAKRNPDPEKSDAFESGFPQFGDSRMKFDIRFYLVTLLFIIFDLEVTFLFPWANYLWKSRITWIFLYDVFLRCLNHWFYIRMEERGT